MKKARHPGNRDSDYPGSMLNFTYRKFRIFDWIPDIFPEIQEKFRDDSAPSLRAITQGLFHF